jgi:hypothetical protein
VQILTHEEDLEAEIAILLGEAKCTALEMVPVLIIGSHKDSKRIKALGLWTRSLWMPRPVRFRRFIVGGWVGEWVGGWVAVA